MIVVYLVNPLLKDLVNPQIIVIYNHYKWPSENHIEYGWSVFPIWASEKIENRQKRKYLK